MTGPPSGYYSVTKEYCIPRCVLDVSPGHATRGRKGGEQSCGITVCRFLRLRGRGCVYAETCVYARGYVFTPAVYTHYRSRIRTRVRVYTRCVYAPSARVFAPTPRIRTPACTPRVYAPLPAYTHPPVYTHPGVCVYAIGIRTYPRIRTHTRVQASVRERGVGCVYTPTCVYAPDAAYTQGRDERHAGAATVVYGLKE